MLPFLWENSWWFGVVVVGWWWLRVARRGGGADPGEGAGVKREGR